MSEKLVRGYVTVRIVVRVDEPDDDSAILTVEHMLARGELQAEILRSVIIGDITFEAEEVKDVE